MLQRVKLRAFDLSERTTERGRASVHARVERWRDRWFMIAQCAVTAALAWWLAQVVLRHPVPFFAPVAALLCLGVTFGHRLRRGVEVAVGVALGVAVGDVFVLLFGTGTWQIAFVLVISMSLATLLGAGQLMIMQAGVQSMLVITLIPDPGQGVGRWLDAVVGCAIALLVATVAPSAPLRRPRILAAEVLQEMSGTLDAARDALRSGDSGTADAVLDRARRGEAKLDALQDASEEGLAVVRLSPFRRRSRPGVEAYAELNGPLGRAQRNLRVLVRRCAVALWRDEEVPAGYLDLMKQLAQVMQNMASELYDGRLPESSRRRLIEIGETSSHLHLLESMSAVVILAQCRSMLVDLMQLTGLDFADARDQVPDMD
jgi:uncharacterized membrane protein YgaE (UPF0421/DUF939 family)